jgi:hypothetical protein
LAVLHALVVPGLVAAGSIAYWVQIAGARRAVVFVPSGVLTLIAIFLAIVVFFELKNRTSQNTRYDWASARRPLGLLVLSVAYYFVFTELGFHVANLLFIFCASIVMGLSLQKSVISAVLATVVLFGLAHVMSFQLPDPFWDRM